MDVGSVPRLDTSAGQSPNAGPRPVRRRAAFIDRGAAILRRMVAPMVQHTVWSAEDIGIVVNETRFIVVIVVMKRVETQTRVNAPGTIRVVLVSRGCPCYYVL